MAAFENIVLAEIVGTLFYTFFGLFLLLASWWIIEAVTPFSLRRELEEEKNVAVAIVMGLLFVSLAIIIAGVIRTP
jgi:uncharacterized membrane protein YjfL (UPF0719 family)